MAEEAVIVQEVVQDKGKMNNIQKDALIAMVETEPWIWDTSRPEYHNKDIKSNCWTKIAGLMNDQFSKEIVDDKKKIFTAEKCAEQWRLLLQYLQSVLRKEYEATKGGQPGSKRKKWLFYNALQFARDKIEAKAPQFTNIPPLASSVSSGTESNDENTCKIADSSRSASTSSGAISTTHSKKVKKECKGDKDLEGIASTMHQVASAMQIYLTNAQTPDEWDHYGERMASSLCKMSPLDRAQVMRDIDAVLNNGKVFAAPRIPL